MNPGGVRIGTPAITSRGMKEEDMVVIADFLMKVIEISLNIQKNVGKNLKNFIDALENNEQIVSLEKEIIDFSSQFEVPGYGENL
jgi:glycine hydroxymethyltransferase